MNYFTNFPAFVLATTSFLAADLIFSNLPEKINGNILLVAIAFVGTITYQNARKKK